MKVGLGTNVNLVKKTEQANSKSVAKNCTNYFIQSNKEPKKKLGNVEILKKTLPKVICTSKNVLASSISSTGTIQSGGIKQNYKSTPEMKGSLKINEENGSKMSKDNFYSVKPNDNKNDIILINDNTVAPATTSSNKKMTPKNTNPKNANVNLWRKPVIVGGHHSSNSNGSNLPTSTTMNMGSVINPTYPVNPNNEASNMKSIIKTSKNKGGISNQKNYNGTVIITNNNTNILSTNHTDNKKEEKELTVEYNYKNTSPIQHYLETPKNITSQKINPGYAFSSSLFPTSSSKTENKMMKNTNFNFFDPTIENEEQRKLNDRDRDNIHINYLTNYNTNINITSNENIQSEILSSILNFKSLIKSNECPGQFDKLLKNEENLNKLNLLNSRLNMYGGGFTKSSISQGAPKGSESKSLLNENNIIKRDTFIEPPLGKHFGSNYIENKYNNININVINAEMLGDDMAKPKQIKKEECPPEGNKEKIIKEIYDHSDLRIKRYEILLDFISSNIKEINQIMNTSNLNHNNYTPAEASRELNRIDEVNSNKLSSLHSKINLNSKTNINMEEGEESDILDKNNGIKKEESQLHSILNFNEHLSTHINKNIYEPSPSFLISSINSEFYQNLLEESILNNNQLVNFNMSNDMGSFRTNQTDHIRKLERIMNNEGDKTPLQYMNRHVSNPSGSNISNFTLSHRATPHFENRINANNGDDGDMFYNEGEENLTDSDLDKTKEHIQVLDSRKLNYNQAVKDAERVKFFSHHNNNVNKHLDVNMKPDLKDNKTSKSPDDKSSKCLIY